MKKSILIFIFLTIVINAHSKLQIKMYYTYYKLGYEYYQSILKSDKTLALKKAKQMCIETIGSIYSDSKYKGSCIYGIQEAQKGQKEIDLKIFLSSRIHERF